MPKSIGCGELGESRPRTVGIRHSANASARFAGLNLVKIKVTGQMRRLLVAAAVSLASASEPFSWADAQNAMHACTNEIVARREIDSEILAELRWLFCAFSTFPILTRSRPTQKYRRSIDGCFCMF